MPWRLVNGTWEYQAPVSAGPVLNVQSFGVTGDGTTDDTAALQALLDAMRDGDIEPGTLFLPPGRYLLSDTLDVNLSRVSIVGANAQRSVLVQSTPNIPILLWDEPGSGSSYWTDTDAVNRGIEIGHLGFEFEDVPTGVTTQQWGIQFRPGPNGDATTGVGWAFNSFHDLWFRHCYTGLGVHTTGSGYGPIWNSEFRRLIFTTTKHRAIDIYPAAGGSTSNLFSRIDVINWDGDGVTPDDIAIRLGLAHGCVLDTINVESWVNTAISIFGHGCTLRNIRTEGHTTGTAFSRLIYLDGDDFVVESVSAEGLKITHAGGPYTLVWLQGTTTRAKLDGMFVSVASGSGNTYAVGGNLGSRIAVAALVLPAAVPEYRTGNDQQYARVSVDGMPPAVSVLPTAAAAYRGRMMRVEGGTGVADVTSVCRKNAADAYEWGAV